MIINPIKIVLIPLIFAITATPVRINTDNTAPTKKLVSLKCPIRVAYRVEKVDPRFGISQEKFTSVVMSAANEWNKTANEEILYISESQNAMPVSLTYNTNQEQLAKKINNPLSISSQSKEIVLGQVTVNLSDSYKKMELYAFVTSADLYATALHEFGHALGLEHSNEKDAVMTAKSASVEKQSMNLNDTDRAMLSKACLQTAAVLGVNK